MTTSGRLLLVATFCSIIIFNQSFASAQFDQIFNIPPDNLPKTVEPRTQINLFNGGVIPQGYVLDTKTSFDEIELNV